MEVLTSLVKRASEGIVESRQGELIGVQVFLICLSGLSFLVRMFARTYISSSYGADDVIMGVAMIFNIGLTANSIVAGNLGWGRHITDINYDNVTGLLLTLWISELIFTWASSFVKLSILFFYLRIAATRFYRRLIYASIAFIIAWLVTFTFAVIFQCRPISAYWHYESNQCFGLTTPLLVHGITSIITDFYIFLLPQPMLWSLQLPRNQKIGIFLLFGIGFLDCIAGTVRLYLSSIANKSTDQTWVGYYFWTWQGVEINIAIVLASIPSFKLLLIHYYPSQRTKSVNNQSGSGKQDSSVLQRRIHSRGAPSMPTNIYRCQRGDDRIYNLAPITATYRGRTDLNQNPESQENLTVTRSNMQKGPREPTAMEYV